MSKHPKNDQIPSANGKQRFGLGISLGAWVFLYSTLDNHSATLKNPNMARVVIEKLTKNFKIPKGEIIQAVKQADLTVEHGEFLVLVGPSGCGKSTTLRLIAGLEEVTSGTISIDGQMVNKVPPQDRDIAMVFQNFALYPHMTVQENMAFGLKLRKMARADIEERVGRAAELLGLKDCLTRKPVELSGGQKQRVAVGRAMVRQPKVFLFDEPLSNLDAPLRVQMRREIAALHARLGTTMLYVTHDQVEAMTLGGRIAVMREGVIQQVAAPMELYDQPTNLFVAGFIGSPAMNFFRGMLRKEGNGTTFSAECPAGVSFKVRVSQEMAMRLGGVVGKKVVMGLRPENITELGGANENAVEAVVELIEPLGAETHLYATSGGHAFVAKVASPRGLKVKQTVPLVFQMECAHFFDAVTEQAIG